MAQSIGFNPIFLSAGPTQFWVLLGVIGCYFLPFLASAIFLGSAFLIGARFFGRVYFADLLGAGLAGLLFLVAMVIVPPRHLLLVPLALWLVSCLAWSRVANSRAMLAAAIVLAAGVVVADVTVEPITTSQYKGVSYARHFPDAQRIYEDWGPQGYLEIYTSSYFHFAPGLSDMAAIDLPSMPENAYLGMFIDGDGPIGLMKELPPDQRAYFRYLPMAEPYLLRPNADTFVAQLGGGISTRVALGLGARSVTAAEPNPLIPRALRSATIAPLVGHVLDDARVKLIPTEGRIAIESYPAHFDVVDLSLVDSIGLSSPGGLSVVEKYAYSRQAMRDYMTALKLRRHPLGHDLEQGKSAQGGAEAADHDARRRPGDRSQGSGPELLRQPRLSLDRDDSLPPRRLYRGRDQAARRLQQAHGLRRGVGARPEGGRRDGCGRAAGLARSARGCGRFSTAGRRSGGCDRQHRDRRPDQPDGRRRRSDRS